MVNSRLCRYRCVTKPKPRPSNKSLNIQIEDRNVNSANRLKSTVAIHCLAPEGKTQTEVMNKHFDWIDGQLIVVVQNRSVIQAFFSTTTYAAIPYFGT